MLGGNLGSLLYGDVSVMLGCVNLSIEMQLWMFLFPIIRVLCFSSFYLNGM